MVRKQLQEYCNYIKSLPTEVEETSPSPIPKARMTYGEVRSRLESLSRRKSISAHHVDEAIAQESSNEGEVESRNNS